MQEDNKTPLFVADELAPGALVERPFTRFGSIALGVFFAIGLTYAAPGLALLQPWTKNDPYTPFWNVIGREFLGEGKVLAAEAAKQTELEKELMLLAVKSQAPSSPPTPAHAEINLKEELIFPPYQSPEAIQEPQWGIEPPEALNGYFRALTLVDLKVPGAIARAGHWGDSIMGIDGISSNIRNRLQARFGDAGHGFHLMSRYNPSYRQEGIQFKGRGYWDRCLVVFECRKKDRHYGYGGLTANSSGSAGGVWSTMKEGFGSTASRFELYFAYQEKGGKVRISVDGEREEIVDTQGPHLQDGFHEVKVEKGPHSFDVEIVGGQNVRAYGIVMENDGPGVVWDGMAHISGSSRWIAKQDAAHIESQVKHRDLDLIVFLYGGNDMQRGYVDLKDSMQPYYDEYQMAIEKYRAAKPNLPCLIMSVTDHGKRAKSGAIESVKYGKVLSKAQRKVAKDNGCGFFDTYEATGGVGTAARWFRARPKLLSPDLGHPSPFGHQLIAGLLTNALLYGYEEYRRKMEGEPLPELNSDFPSNEALSPTKQNTEAKE